MQDTLNSLVRLSTAIAIFGVQQVQTAVGSASPREVAGNLREVVDGMTLAVSAAIDESRLPQLDGMFSLGRGVAGRAGELATGILTGILHTSSGLLSGMARIAAPVSSGDKTR